MKEVKLLFRIMGIYGLIYIFAGFINILSVYLCFPPHAVSTIFLMVLVAILFVYYYMRLSEKGIVRFLMMGIVFMLALWVMLRAAKYEAFREVHSIARMMWYLYYLPNISMPLMIFYIAVVVNQKDSKRALKRWLWTAVVSGIMVLIIATNDFHQLVFTFNEEKVAWDSDYGYGLMWYVINIWMYGMYIASFVIMIFKCRITAMKRYSWVPVIPFVIGVPLLILCNLGVVPKLRGVSLVGFAETLMFIIVSFLECCIQIGFIPTNTNHDEILKHSGIGIMLVDSNGKTKYVSEDCNRWSDFDGGTYEEQYMLDENTIVRRVSYRGGYGYWIEDITEMNRINEVLEEMHDKLNEERKLVELDNQLKEKSIKLEQRTKIYDRISSQLEQYIEKIKELRHKVDMSDGSKK